MKNPKWIRILDIAICTTIIFLIGMFLFSCATIPEAPRSYQIYPTQIVIIDKDVDIDMLKALGGIIQNVPVSVSGIDVDKKTSAEGGDVKVPIKVVP